VLVADFLEDWRSLPRRSPAFSKEWGGSSHYLDEIVRVSVSVWRGRKARGSREQSLEIRLASPVAAAEDLGESAAWTPNRLFQRAG